MGFMDKLKDVGGKVAKGALTMASAGYGDVTGGKYKGTKIGFNQNKDLVFTQVGRDDAVVKPETDIETFYTTDDISAQLPVHTLIIRYTDGETSTVSINVEKVHGYLSLSKLFIELGRVKKVSDETKQWVNNMLKFAELSPLYK